MVVKTKGTPQSLSKQKGKMTPAKTPKKSDPMGELDTDEGFDKKTPMKGAKATPASAKKQPVGQMTPKQQTPGNKLQQTPGNAMKAAMGGKTPKQQATPGNKQVATPKGKQGKQTVQMEMSEEDDEDEDDEEFDSEMDDEDEDSELESEEDESEEEEESAGGVPQSANVQSLQTKRSAQQASVESAAQKRQKMNSGESAQVGSKLKAAKGAKTEDASEESEDDDDEDLDDEESEEEDEESDEQAQQSPGNKKGQKGVKASKGAMEQAKKKAPHETRPTMPMKLDAQLKKDMIESKRTRARCSLFFKNAPKFVEDADLKALSADIVEVHRRDKHLRYGWLVFANEETCKKNYEKLKNATIKGEKLTVDQCGNKDNTEKVGDYEVDALTLHIASLPASATTESVKQLFPTAKDVFVRTLKRFAFAHFDTPEKARQAYEKAKSASIDGMKLDVTFARLPGTINKGKGKPGKKQQMKKENTKKQAKQEANGKVAVKA